MAGWIKLHRKIRDSTIFNDHQLFRLWMICLTEASHKEKDLLVGKQTVHLMPGEFVTGRYDIADLYNQGLKPKDKVKGDKTVFRWLEALEKGGYLTLKKTNKFSIVSIDNWRFYQSDDQELDQQETNKRPSNDQQMTTNKNVKNVKNKDLKDLSTKISDFRSTYDSYLLSLIDSYLNFIAGMRKHKKIADSIVLRVFEQFARYSSEQVEYAIRTHMSNETYSKAQEAYTFGILRNTSKDEALKKLPQLRNGKGNKVTPINSRFDQNKALLKKKMEATQNEGSGSFETPFGNGYSLPDGAIER